MADQAATPHMHRLLAIAPGVGWLPGQLCFHPDTLVLCGAPPLPSAAARPWGLMACTWRGRCYWYGWAECDLDSGRVAGWLLMPRTHGESHFD